jgi:hypothetical protein
VLRLAAPVGALPRQTDWPAFALGAPATVFCPRPPLRELRVVIDNELLDAASERRGELTPEVLLAGLLSHEYITLLRYGDDGPGVELPRREAGAPRAEAVDGWVLVPPASASDRYPFIPVVTSDGRSVLHSSLSADFVRAAESDERTTAYVDLPAPQRRERRRLDLLAAQAAHAASADLFISERDYLHAASWRFADGVLVARLRDALPLVSLYLRSQGQYYTWRSTDGTGSHRMNKGLFYWVGTRDLVHAGWRWFSACVQHAGASQDDRILYLAQSLFQRVQRALMARDETHRALNMPQDNDTADAALDGLDQVLVALMAAVDVSARVAHLALELPTDRLFDAGWQRSRWRELVAERDSQLADVAARDTANAGTITILSKLRNSIHGAALSALAIGGGRMRREGTLVGLPHADADVVVAVMEACGGQEQWGIQQLLPDRVHADPGILLDRILSATAALLNDLLEHTPVENLYGVSIDPEAAEPPANSPFTAQQRESIRWQLGL